MSVQAISRSEIHQTIASNQVTELQLKDGTILKITPGIDQSIQQNYLLKAKVNLIKRKHKNQTENVQKNLNDQGIHNHHKDGLGSFGQHFKTEYGQFCPDCTEGPGGIVKRRQNYVLYVSKNVTEANLSKKKKNCDYEVNQNAQYQQPIQIGQNYQKTGEKVISQGYVDVNDVPIFEPKIRLRSEQGMCPDCCQAEKGLNAIPENAVEENLCPECNAEQVDNINVEKITTTVKVLVPENDNKLQ